MLQIVPPNLVPAAQALIAQQGGNPYLLQANGELNPDGVLALFFNQAEVRTSITPSLIFPIGPTGAPASPMTDALISSLQPTVILSGPAGRVEIAPYGVTQGAGSWWPLAIGGGAAAFVIWWLLK